MATPLTSAAAIKAASQNQVPQLVLKIQGYSTLIGLGAITEYIEIGDEGLLIGDDWVIGGIVPRVDALDVIDIKGSSRTLTSQINPDRATPMSVPNFGLSLIDINQAITRLITPAEILPDILGNRADLYLGYKDTAFPQDFVRLISGIIDRVEAGATITLNVAHPEQKKRTELFTKATTELTQAARFRSKDIQGITYKTRRDVVTSATVTYIAGGTAGSEVVTVVGTNITVQLQVGVSTANNVRNAVENSGAALALVTTSVITDMGATMQTTQATTTLDTSTTIDVLSTEGFLLPAPAYGLRTYVRIDDEVIEYTGLTDTTFTGVTREALKAQDERAEGAHHDAETSVESFYRLEGDAITMALRLLMSNGGTYEDIVGEIKSIGEIEGVSVANAVYFFGIDLSRDYGRVIGDFVTITGDPNPVNNVVDAVITDLVSTQFGSYLVLGSESLTLSLGTPATITFKSKYNVYPEGAGLGLTGEECDVPRFQLTHGRFAASIFNYDFYIKDTMQADAFIEKALHSTGAYSVPRFGKVSVAYTSPPLGLDGFISLDEDSTQAPQGNKITRSINKFFYNAVVFAFNEAVVDERFLSGDVTPDTVSRARIKIGSRPLTIECGGIRPTPENLEIIRVLRERFKDKYRFGAEVIEIKAMYGKSFNRDVGDSILFGSGLNLVDTKVGSRNFVPRLWDILNKSLTPVTGEVKFTLMDSAYSIKDARYGVVSPSSIVGTGSTTTAIKVTPSYDVVAPTPESIKWREIIGIKLYVHNEDFTVGGYTYLTGISPSDANVLIVAPPLAFTPAANYVVDIAPYPDNADPEDDAIAKATYVFTNPTVAVVSGVSNTSFNINILEAPLFKEGAVLLVHNEDYTILSPEVRIVSIVGTLVTVDADLTFTPSAGHEAELIGYKDLGAPYRYF